MKYQGKAIKGPENKIIPILRESGNIFLTIQAVVDFEPFYKICPMPEAPTILKPGGVKSRDVNDKAYLAKIREWAEKKTAWIFVNSFLATPGFEWETVDLSDPDTLLNWTKEFDAVGFTEVEANRIVQAIHEVNGLNNEMLEAAKKDFLAGLEEAKNKQSSLLVDQKTMPSGVPASV